jgi:hypothetical protein
MRASREPKMKILLTRRRAARGLALLPLGSILGKTGNIACQQDLRGIETTAWVWNFDPSEAAAVNAFAVANGISTLFVSVPMSARTKLIGGDVEILERLRSLSWSGIEIWASAGDPGWAEQPERASQPLRSLFTIQERYGLFHGLHLDVEPHAHPSWQRGQRARMELAQGYLTLIAAVGKQASGLPIDAAIHPGLSFFTLPEGANLLLQVIQHVFSISIMAYRNTATATLEWADATMRLLQDAAVPWRLGVLVHAASEQRISFADYTLQSFLQEMRTLDRQVRTCYGERFYRGLAFEDYAGLRTLLNKS